MKCRFTREQVKRAILFLEAKDKAAKKAKKEDKKVDKEEDGDTDESEKDQEEEKSGKKAKKAKKKSNSPAKKAKTPKEVPDDKPEEINPEPEQDDDVETGNIEFDEPPYNDDDDEVANEPEQAPAAPPLPPPDDGDDLNDFDGEVDNTNDKQPPKQTEPDDEFANAEVDFAKNGGDYGNDGADPYLPDTVPQDDGEDLEEREFDKKNFFAESKKYAPNTVGAVIKLLERMDPNSTLRIRDNGKTQYIIYDLGQRIGGRGETWISIAPGKPE